jgi:putative transposase
MTTRKFPFVTDEFYHLYNRGVDKRVIYLDDKDYQRFAELLFLVNSSKPINIRSIHEDINNVYDFDRGEQLVAIGAYCLMPNHFHLLMTPLVDGGVSAFMGKLCTSYSMYFNQKYERTGTLFEGKFKARHANNDEYLKYLYSYIHLNPIKLIDSTWKEKGISDSKKAYLYASSYEYSSLPDYTAEVREQNKIINPNPFPDYFLNPGGVQKELLEWLTYSLYKEESRG